jgi:hypothetical protein
MELATDIDAYQVAQPSNTAVLIRYSQHMPKQDLQCPFCPKTSSRGTGLASHIRGAHSKQYTAWSKTRKTGQKTAVAAAKPMVSDGGLVGIVASLKRQRDAVESALSALRAVGGAATGEQGKRKRGRPRKIA